MLFPIMSQVVQDYLAVPLAEVDVERLFSIGRDLLGLQRHCIALETMKAILLLCNEYKKQHNV
jgi:hAT family C-terminal dimerisation region